MIKKSKTEKGEKDGTFVLAKAKGGESLGKVKVCAGGKGTWGKLLDTDIDSHIDRNDPNYDSGEVNSLPLFCW